MKKILIAAAIFATAQSQAQIKEGRIVYTRTFKLPEAMLRNMPDGGRSLPKTRTDHFELLFSNNQTLWQNLPDATGEGGDMTVTSNGGASVMSFRMGNNDISLVDLNQKTKTDYREMFDRNFQVADTLSRLQWKMTDERKTILNHPAFKAVSQRISMRPRMTMENGVMKREEFADTAKVVAWFTTDIPVAGGPDFAGQLPGMILELEVGDGQTVYQATEISDKVNASRIKLPKNGKKVTAAEFKTERDQMMEEMRKRMPADGSRSIRIN